MSPALRHGPLQFAKISDAVLAHTVLRSLIVIVEDMQHFGPRRPPERTMDSNAETSRFL